MKTKEQLEFEQTVAKQLNDDPWRTSIDEKVSVLARSQSELHQGQQQIMEAVRQNTVLTEDVAEIVNLAKSFFRFWGWVGRKGALVARPVGIIAAACTAVWVVIYQLLHNGNLPK